MSQIISEDFIHAKCENIPGAVDNCNNNKCRKISSVLGNNKNGKLTKRCKLKQTPKKAINLFLII
jgi:hypothetical protein